MQEHPLERDVCAIGLYNIGGIGKSTICKSLCNIQWKVWHKEVGKKRKEIQKDVLHDLVGIIKTLFNKSANYKDKEKRHVHLSMIMAKMW